MVLGFQIPKHRSHRRGLLGCSMCLDARATLTIENNSSMHVDSIPGNDSTVHTFLCGDSERVSDYASKVQVSFSVLDLIRELFSFSSSRPSDRLILHRIF